MRSIHSGCAQSCVIQVGPGTLIEHQSVLLVNMRNARNINPILNLLTLWLQLFISMSMCMTQGNDWWRSVKLTTRSPNRYDIWLKHKNFKPWLYLDMVTYVSLLCVGILGDRFTQFKSLGAEFLVFCYIILCPPPKQNCSELGGAEKIHPRAKFGPRATSWETLS